MAVSVTGAYRWLNSWKEKLLCRRICGAIARVVFISTHIEAISKIDQ
jgi:hypothetical protein